MIPGWAYLSPQAVTVVIVLAAVALSMMVGPFLLWVMDNWGIWADRRKERREREKARQAARQAARPPVSRSGVGSQPPPVPVRVPVQARRVRVHPRPVPKALLPYEADLSDIDVDAIVREYRGEHR